MSPALRVIAIGVAGVLLAVALAFFSYHLINEPVGLSSEPTRAGDLLIPAGATPPPARPPRDGDGSGGSDGDRSGHDGGDDSTRDDSHDDSGRDDGRDDSDGDSRDGDHDRDDD